MSTPTVTFNLDVAVSADDAYAAQIDRALAAHGEWKRRLAAAIETGECQVTVDAASVDDRCAFGQWLHQTIPWRLRKTWDYQNIRRRHAEFHRCAGQVLALALTGRSDSAQRAMAPGSPFAEASERLEADLLEWGRLIERQAIGEVY